MKKSIIMGVLALSFSSLMYAQTSEVSIVPVDATGNTNHDGTDYPDKVVMTLNSDGTYSATGVTIEHGFYFLGNNATDGTLYSLSSWAVTPAVQIGPNPLSIASDSMKNYIATSGDSYDVTFIPAAVGGTSFNMFTIVPAGETRGAYPEQIYLAKGPSASDCVAISGSGGVYTMDVTEAIANFKISYEPRNSYAPFIYGPADDSGAVALTEGTRVGISRATGTGTTFSVQPTEGANTHLTVSLVDGDQYVEVFAETVTAIQSPEVAATSAVFYTLSGVKVDGDATTLPSGVYIAITADGAHKVALRR